jgi:Tfp pilus assembly protein PilW
MTGRQRGSTIVELLVVLVPISLVAAGALTFFAAQNRTHIQQDAVAALEDNLRAAMGMVTETLRSAGCGVPTSNLADWITWVPGFDDDPLIVTDGGAVPDRVSAAACAPQPVATLNGTANVDDTTLSLASNYTGITIATLFNNSDKSLIWIGDTQHARVTAVSGNTITIDVDPTTTGNQGVTRRYLNGTPITRIDVFTFEIVEDVATGVPWLRIDRHRGTEDPAAEGISDLQITAVDPGEQYRVTLTAEAIDPVTHAVLTQTLSSDMRVRN